MFFQNFMCFDLNFVNTACQTEMGAGLFPRRPIRNGHDPFIVFLRFQPIGAALHYNPDQLYSRMLTRPDRGSL